MKMAFRLLAVLAAASPSATFSTQVTPITKVIQLLNEMHANGVKAKEDEANKMSAFRMWCNDQDRIKSAEINTATEQMNMLNAGISKATSQIRGLTDRIQELDEDIGRWTKDTKSATDVRQKEAADFTATVQDYSESIDALTQAIAVLLEQSRDRPQAELAQVQQALIQVTRSRVVPLSTKSALAAFLQQPSVEEMPDQRLFNEAPEAYGYEFQSGGVVDMLKKLKDEFKTKKYELEHEELNAQHAYQQLAQQLTDNTENAKHEIEKKETRRAETQQAKAEAEGDLALTTADRAEDQKYLQETVALCQMKNADFESREKLRTEELEAIQQAISILSDDTVSGAGEKHLPTLLQKTRSSLAQLRSNIENPLQARVALFLSDRARQSSSRLLSLVSQRVASDPFTKVKRMIKDLIFKLMEEATTETEHKGWCDTELTTNKQTREYKTEEVNKLSVEREDLTTTIEQLTQDIADLTSSVAELTAAMAQATSERTASKDKNEQTIQEAKDAQAAVMQATAVLKDFYAKASEATALLQQVPADDAPETFSKPYQGQLPEGGNVISFLEVILSDFARLESETMTAETTEVDEFKQYMFESEKDKALKETDMGHKQEKKADKESALHATVAELKATQEQLDKAVEYYEKLKPTCVDSGITYEERVKRREEEIQSLQEALKILAGTDVDLA